MARWLFGFLRRAAGWQGMGCGAVKSFSRFHQGFRQSRVRVNAVGKVARGGAQLDRQHSFADQFAGAVADNSDTENALGLRFDDQFGQAIGTIECQCAPGCAP